MLANTGTHPTAQDSQREALVLCHFLEIVSLHEDTNWRSVNRVNDAELRSPWVSKL